MTTFNNGWTRKETMLDNSNLTEMETSVLIASRTNNYNDCFEYPTWSFAVEESSKGVTPEQFRGVVSSLIKKGLAVISKDGTDIYFGLTQAGANLFSDKADF